MKFYKIENQEISKKDWINIFQPYYYLGGQTYHKKINGKNQGSKYVEEKIEQILNNGLEKNDLPLIIAWKIGAINHKESENQKTIIYKNNFGRNFQLKTQYGLINARDIIHYCIDNFEKLISNKNAEQVFNDLMENRGKNNKFGLVYCITLLYFFTRGQCPIYDKFAHLALDAISLNKQMGTHIVYRQINNWREYNEKYVNRLKELFGSQYISREIDRTLWVYGHFFQNNLH